MKKIPASKFKSKCLSLLDEVNKKHETIIVTKHGKPVARLVPYLKNAKKQDNPLKGSIVFEKDIVGPIMEDWDVTL